MAAGRRSDTERWRELDSPRIPPASSGDLSLLVRPLVAIAGRVVGGMPPNIFTTLGRHGRLFVPWLLFASRLMPGGRLPRRDTELVILRVAHDCSCRYEWDHHVRLGARAGLSEADIERVGDGPGAPGWSEREQVLLQATDELLSEERFITDATWARLSEFLEHRELIELCMLVGHYGMLAGTIASLGIQPEQPLEGD
jgi:AhpD family alkylhydroperoxidase